MTLPEGPLRLAVAACTDLGRVRRVNEDSFLAEPPLFLVADGMGGHSFGDRASRAVVEAFSAAVGTDGLPSPELVVETIRAANEAVVALSDEETVSGTTLSGLALVAAHSSYHWMAFNVGDSRVYSWDGRALEQVTVDHSAVQEMLDLGQISALEAIDHPYRNVVTRAIGIDDSVEPDVWLLPVGGHQLFLVCSDGLTKELDDDQIASILADRFSLPEGQSVADRLVQAALAAGGSDNVTVIVVEAELADTAHSADEDTNDRGMPGHLEETRPRK
ncbi:PP2C family protein-serine/threonine phosphatase [Homoserinimonas aerilata]|uniref:PP2C family protein-serine/threonine phosphatase n=1 Tax=Homoserinimonas aerilata TaxID=1162970 RepID=UPI001FE43683|nr:protein phosphatase 2C domain-containing protein [Homoserinimonas aerilata]